MEIIRFDMDCLILYYNNTLFLMRIYYYIYTYDGGMMETTAAHFIYNLLKYMVYYIYTLLIYRRRMNII